MTSEEQSGSEGAGSKGSGWPFFLLSLGAGIVVGAGLAVLLLEVREYLKGTIRLARRERELTEAMVDVIGDFAALGAGSLEAEAGALSPESIERLRQQMKTRLRRGEGSLYDLESSEEMEVLYSELESDDS